MVPIRRQLSRAALRMLRGIGAFALVRDSKWRRQRLLILCYHGVSLDDEHLWRPALYIEPERLEQRWEILKRGGYSVLPLAQALQQLHSGTLPARSVALTFDDGMYDFYARAYPLLRRFGFPATVYQTTYYVDRDMPVFNLMCSYLLWKRRGQLVEAGRELGLSNAMDLRTEASREQIVRTLSEVAQRENLSGPQKDELVRRLAVALGVDYEAFLNRRLLHLMNTSEIAKLASHGIDFQLHTHRHRAPIDETRFRQEIRQNRQRLLEITQRAPEHFCYPSGVYDVKFMAWLAAERIVSATTCDSALATRQTNLLLLPRFVDTTGRTDVEFESWLSGVGDLLAARKRFAVHEEIEPSS